MTVCGRTGYQTLILGVQILKHIRVYRVATVREKYLENEIFSRSGKSQGILWIWPGKFRKDLESQGKVREFENKWLWLADFRKFIYSVQKGGKCTFT